eukprot:176044-Prorocentrum_minimum.AAC.3
MGGAKKRKGNGKPKTGDPETIVIQAKPDFYSKNESRECPLLPWENTGGENTSLGPDEKRFLLHYDKNSLEALLKWFDVGTDGDNDALLKFPSSLSKYQRAEVHNGHGLIGYGFGIGKPGSMAMNMGLGTKSSGFGKDRCVAVSGACASDFAYVPIKLGEKEELQAHWTWKWAIEAGHKVTRDEVYTANT